MKPPGTQYVIAQNSKNSSKRRLYYCFKFFITLILSFSIAHVTFANPEGGQVVAGSVTISSTGTSTVQVNQSSDKAIVNWNSFNIGANEKTVFNQPSASSMILNRINPMQGVSQIFGQLTANGKIILINPAGIFFGPSASVNVAGIIASTSNITNENFLSGNYIFDQPSVYAGSVINKGSIKAGDAGLVALIGTSVENDGLIVAKLGTVVLASGEKFIFSFSGNQLINFAVSAPTSHRGVDENGTPLQDSVSNRGKIIANGGKIIMTAREVNHVLNSSINMSGVLIANSVQQKNGVIILSAGHGKARVTGKIYASGKHKKQTGGVVQILGKNIEVAQNAKIDVSGYAGGGSILIGGRYNGKTSIPIAKNTFLGNNVILNASATNIGNGGNVIVTAKNTTQFYGTVLSMGGVKNGNGGFVEASGKNNLIFNAYVNTLALNGKTGTLLIDPRTITVASSGSATLSDVDSFSKTPSTDVTISSSTLNNATSNIILQANRDIRFNDNVSLIQPGISLTAQAGRDIIVSNNISIATNNGDISFFANDSSAVSSNRGTGTGDITMNAGSSLNAGTGNINLTIGSSTTSPFNPGSISLRNLTGNAIIVDGEKAVTLNSNSVINATGPITIHANTSGSSGQNFVMNTGSSITTSDASSNAVLIAVNTSSGGTGAATLRGISTGLGGTINVTTDTDGNTTGGTISLSSGTLSGGNVILSSANAITLTGSINAEGAVDITTNTSGSGGKNFTMNAGSSITTSDASSSAVTISVNNSSSGTGAAQLRDITTGDGGNITIMTNPNGNTTGGDITQASGTLNAGSGTITLSTPKATGNNIGTSANNINIIAGLLNAISGSSGIFITESGANTLNLGVIDTSSTTGSAQLISHSSVIQASGSAITVNGFTVTTENDSGASITLNNLDNNVSTINLKSRNLANTANANGAISYRNISGLTIAGLSTTNSADIVTGGAVTQSADIAATTLSVKTLNDSGSGITLSRAGNEVGTINLQARNLNDTANAAGAITYRDASGVNISNINTASTFSLTTAGSVTQSGALTITGTPRFTIRSGNFDILLSDAANSFSTTPVISTAAGGSIRDLALRNISAIAQVPVLPTGIRNLTLLFDNTGMVLPAMILSGNLNVAAGGNISQSGILQVNASNATATFSAGSGHDITLTNASNDFSTLSISSANNVNVDDVNSLILGKSIVSGNLSITANGAITQSDSLSVSGNTALASGLANDITLTNDLNDFNSVSINSANNASITDKNSISFASSVLSGNLTITSGGVIDQTGSFNIPGTLTTTSIGGVALTNIGNNISTFNATNSGSGAIELTTTAAPLTLTGINQSGGGSVAITNTGTIAIANGSSIDVTGGDVALTAVDLDLGISGAINIYSGDLTIVQNTNGGSVAVGNGTGTMTLSNDILSRITANNLFINTSSDGQMTVDGVIKNDLSNISAVILSATAGTLGNITFEGGSSSFNTITANANNGIKVNASLSSAGNLTLNGDYDAITSTNDALLINSSLTADGNINLSAQNGGILLGSPISISGVNITFNSKVDGAYDLTLNSGTNGDIVFNQSVGSLNSLQNVTVINANNFTSNASINAQNYLQSAGSGTTYFGGNGMSLTHNATITTNIANGNVNVESLALDTNFANLNGFVNGLTGENAINIITLLNTISYNTHFFDGIDMYLVKNSSQTPQTPQTPQISQILVFYLYENSKSVTKAMRKPFLSNGQITRLLSDIDSGARMCVSIGLAMVCSSAGS